MYDELINRLREYATEDQWVQTRIGDTFVEAADVIEELSKRSECPCWYGGIRFCSMLGKPIPKPQKEET